MKWKDILAAELKAARDIAMRAKSAGRDLTDDEVKDFDAAMAKATEARDALAKAAAADARFQALADIGSGFDPNGDGNTGGGSGASGKAGRVLSFKGAARQLKASMADRGGYNVKSLLSAGSTATVAEELTSPVAMAQPATGLLDLLPVRFLDDTDQYNYLRQVTRTNNAAPVAAGGLKPTSVYTLERVSRELQVIAHLSEPIPEYWLADNEALSQFVGGELGYGLQVAVEDQVLNGNGTAPNLDGLLSVSGIQVQTYNTSQIRTVRAAITKIETMGYAASGIALHPVDWEAIETAEDANERYLLGNEGSPIDRAARRLWGVPVALTIKVAQGSGVLLADGAAQVVADRKLNMQWGRVGDDFSHNLIRARYEGRFGVEVFRPSGIVKMTLHA